MTSGPDPRAAAPSQELPPGEIPAPPPDAADVFGATLPLAERYVQMLAGPGVTRGLLGPREVPRAAELPHTQLCGGRGSGAQAGHADRSRVRSRAFPGYRAGPAVSDIQVTLLERMERRAIFLDECVQELGLGNAQVCRATAEEVAGKQAADVVTARAVVPLDRLAGLAAGLVRRGGLILCYQGGDRRRGGRPGPAGVALAGYAGRGGYPGRGR